MWRKVFLAAIILLGGSVLFGQAPSLPPSGVKPPANEVAPATPSSNLPSPPNIPFSTPLPGQPGKETALEAPPTVPTAPSDEGGEVLTFNTRQVNLLWRNGRWLLVAGRVLLKDFGRADPEAHQVLGLIRELNLNARGTIGSPQPVMEYWLSNGQAPSRTPPGLRLVPLNSDRLQVGQVQGQWCLGDDKRILLNFGSQQAAARQALATIKHYGFSRVGVVGRVTPLMLLFLAGGPAPGESFGQLSLNGTTLSQPVSQAERLFFDSHQLQVRRRGNDWQLAMANRVLASFGPNEADARHAREVLRQYRCTEQVLIGRPRPVLAYYLANGEAPRGTMLGLRSFPFRPESLEVRQVGNTNVLWDGSQAVMRLDDRLPEAQEVLQTIRHFRFDRLSHIGPDGGGLTLLIRTR